MSRNDELLSVIDNMLEKLDTDDSDFYKKDQSEFDNELKNKLNAVARQNGFDNYDDMLKYQEKRSEQPPCDYCEIYDFVKEAVDNLEYEPKQNGLYKDGNQEALKKCLEKLYKASNIDRLLEECYREEKSINSFDTIRDVKLKGYKDGLYLFSIMVSDAIEELNNR